MKSQVAKVVGILGLMLAVGIVAAPYVNRFVAERDLTAENFSRLENGEAAQALKSGLQAGALEFRSSEDVAQWLSERPNSFQAPPNEASPLLQATRGPAWRKYPDESRAWLLVANEWVAPTIKADQGLIGNEWLRNAVAVIRSRGKEEPGAANIIANRIHQKYEAQPVGTSRWTVGSPVSDAYLLSAVEPDSQKLMNTLERGVQYVSSVGDPMISSEFGIAMIYIGADTMDSGAKKSLVSVGARLFHEAKYDKASWSGQTTFYGDDGIWSVRDALLKNLVALVVEQECFDRTKPVLPLLFAEYQRELDNILSARFDTGTDALCLWSPAQWVPSEYLLAQRPERVRSTILMPQREGDWLRRDLLIAGLAPYILYDLDFSKNGRLAKKDMGTPISANYFSSLKPILTPPAHQVRLGDKLRVEVQFKEKVVHAAWKKRLPRSSFKGSFRDLRAQLVPGEADVQADPDAIRRFETFAGSRTFRADVWGTKDDAFRLAIPQGRCIQCDDHPALLVQGKRLRIVALSRRWNLSADYAADRQLIVGVGDIDADGNPDIVSAGFDRNCIQGGCSSESIELAVDELFQEGFSTFMMGPHGGGSQSR